MLDKTYLKELKELGNKLNQENREIINEFLSVASNTSDMDELDEYVDLLLGIADEIDEEEQKIIYNVISDIQK